MRKINEKNLNKEKLFKKIIKKKFFKLSILIWLILFLMYFIPFTLIVILILHSKLENIWIGFIEFIFSLFFALITLIIALIIDNKTTNNINENKKLINNIELIVLDIRNKSNKILDQEGKKVDQETDNKKAILNEEKENIFELEEKIKS